MRGRRSIDRIASLLVGRKVRHERIGHTLQPTALVNYFGGLTIEETSEVMGLSPATVKRQWTAARAWLPSRLDRSATP